ncbi:glycosyltransferase [Ascidiaceihabitans sp.]|nr:glycosyltransferase [Ascidiaceihabitans sp.]
MIVVSLNKFTFPYSGGMESVSNSIIHDVIVENDENVVLNICSNPQIQKPIATHERERIYFLCPFFFMFNMPVGFFVFNFIKLLIQNAQLQYLRKIDAIVFHYPNPQYLGLLLVLKLFNPFAKVIIFWHCDIQKKGFLGKLVNWFCAFIFRLLNSQFVFTSQEYAKESDARFFVNSGNVNFTKISGNVSVSVDHDGRFSKKILFVGRLVEYKNLDFLVRLMEKLPDYTLTIIGSGVLYDELDQLVSSLGLNERVLLKGFVDDNALKEYFSEADIFFLPSINKAEAYGVVQVEAAAGGCHLFRFRIKGSGVSSVFQNHSFVHTFDIEDVGSILEKLTELELKGESYWNSTRTDAKLAAIQLHESTGYAGLIS